MGISPSQFPNAAFLGQEVVDVKEIEYRDPRRRNSLAYNIASYVRFNQEEDSFDDILNEIRTERNKVVYKIRAATAKYTAIAEAVLHVSLHGLVIVILMVMKGSMKEVRDQTLQSYRTINRKFRDQFLNQTLLHFICQEGYYVMLEFVIDPKNHSVFEDEGGLPLYFYNRSSIFLVLDINPKDVKGRTPLYLCFTPPTATYLGLKYGLNEDGYPLPMR